MDTDEQALSDEEAVDAIYNQYIEDQYNAWAAEQERQYAKYVEMIAYLEAIEGPRDEI